MSTLLTIRYSRTMLLIGSALLAGVAGFVFIAVQTSRDADVISMRGVIQSISHEEGTFGILRARDDEQARAGGYDARIFTVRFDARTAIYEKTFLVQEQEVYAALPSVRIGPEQLERGQYVEIHVRESRSGYDALRIVVGNPLPGL